MTEAEIRKAQSAYERDLVLSLQSTEFRADFLNRGNVQDGDPLAYKARIRAIFGVTPADVKRVARTYLTANRVRLDVIPGPLMTREPDVALDRKSQSPLPSPPVVAIRDTFDRSLMPQPGPAPRFTPPPIVRRALSNGMDVLVVERHGLPLLQFRLVLKGGETLVPADKLGLARLTANLLDRGDAYPQLANDRQRARRHRRHVHRRGRPRIDHRRSQHDVQAHHPRWISSPTCCSTPYFPRRRSTG